MHLLHRRARGGGPAGAGPPARRPARVAARPPARPARPPRLPDGERPDSPIRALLRGCSGGSGGSAPAGGDAATRGERARPLGCFKRRRPLHIPPGLPAAAAPHRLPPSRRPTPSTPLLPSPTYPPATAAYEAALELSRQQRYGAAREAFEALVREHPGMCKAWVSYAQMEKRIGRTGEPERLHIARYILQRGAGAWREGWGRWAWALWAVA
jgi:hypothetical protein